MDIFTLYFMVKLLAVVLFGYLANKLIVAIAKKSFALYTKIQKVRYTKNLIESGVFYTQD